MINNSIKYLGMIGIFLLFACSAKKEVKQTYNRTGHFVFIKLDLTIIKYKLTIYLKL